MKITKINGGAFHLPGDDIDTDRIIPARFLKCVTFEGLGEHVFEDDRKQLNGHPFDQPKNRGCSILVADLNFGCGSSREHAVAAIQRWGIKAVIARSFAAIFGGNAVGNGLVCVAVSEAAHRDVVATAKATPSNSVTIDLLNMEITLAIPGESTKVGCNMSPADRNMLITGKWDTTATLLQAEDQIEATAARLPYFV